jgi:hypothetical protein
VTESTPELSILGARIVAFGVPGAGAIVYALHAEVMRGSSPAVLLDRALDQTGYRAWLERHHDGPSRLRAIARRAEVGLSEWLDALAVGDDVDPVGSDH